MLVLERRANQTVDIYLPNGDRITVNVVRVEGGKTRLAFEAPRDCTILRGELLPRTESPRAA